MIDAGLTSARSAPSDAPASAPAWRGRTFGTSGRGERGSAGVEREGERVDERLADGELEVNKSSWVGAGWVVGGGGGGIVSCHGCFAAAPPVCYM